MIRSITVYCSSSRHLAPHYYAAGVELGRAIAANGWTLVYGGNALGLMQSVADSVRAGGGRVVGITPQCFVDEGCDDKHCDELIVTASMRERKELLERRGDALVALPGGLGTFEELLEVIVGRALRFHDKPIVLLNIAGYWNPLLAMIERGIEERFIKPRARELYHVAETVAEAVKYLQRPHSGGNHAPNLPSATE